MKKTNTILDNKFFLICLLTCILETSKVLYAWPMEEAGVSHAPEIFPEGRAHSATAPARNGREEQAAARGQRISTIEDDARNCIQERFTLEVATEELQRRNQALRSYQEAQRHSNSGLDSHVREQLAIVGRFSQRARTASVEAINFKGNNFNLENEVPFTTAVEEWRCYIIAYGETIRAARDAQCAQEFIDSIALNIQEAKAHRLYWKAHLDGMRAEQTERDCLAEARNLPLGEQTEHINRLLPLWDKTATTFSEAIECAKLHGMNQTAANWELDLSIADAEIETLESYKEQELFPGASVINIGEMNISPDRKRRVKILKKTDDTLVRIEKIINRNDFSITSQRMVVPDSLLVTLNNGVNVDNFFTELRNSFPGAQLTFTSSSVNTSRFTLRFQSSMPENPLSLDFYNQLEAKIKTYQGNEGAAVRLVGPVSIVFGN